MRDPLQLYNEWRVFHEQNPHIYKLICRFTNQLIRAGHDRYGMGAVCERVRWEITVTTTSNLNKHFKIPNNHRAYYSRHWLKRHPERPKFFRIAHLRSMGAIPVDRWGLPL